MAARSVLEQFSIADLLEWFKKKRLKINPEFQRRDVWTPDARSYLIDTILHQLPLPKIFMRTKIDLRTQTSYREIVDGQQRLRAIFDFATGKLTLNKRAEDFVGLTYEQLDDQRQKDFLNYTVGVEQLINASDDDVLAIFSRLNSYTVPLSPAEKRHAKYKSDFKWSVHNSALRWEVLWNKFNLISVRQRVRMLDDSFMAELYGIHMRGVCDGGQVQINKLYDSCEGDAPDVASAERSVNSTLDYITSDFKGVVKNNLSIAPHFLMLYAAVAHARKGIPDGQMGELMPRRNQLALSDLEAVAQNLGRLDEVISEQEPPEHFFDFWEASKQTHRIKGRRVRFPLYFKALLPGPLLDGTQ
jgi:hypothetical protein